MKTDELKKLLKKYYDGESSTGEEKALRVFFSGKNIPDGFEAEKAIFGYFRDAMDIPEPSEDFAERIIAGIDRPVVKHGISKKFLVFYSAAASVIVLTSLWFLLEKNKPDDTYSDPRIAYAETIRILYNVSNELNKGSIALEPVSKLNETASQSLRVFSESAEKVQTSMTRLDPLDKAFNIINSQNEENK